MLFCISRKHQLFPLWFWIKAAKAVKGDFKMGKGNMGLVFNGDEKRQGGRLICNICFGSKGNIYVFKTIAACKIRNHRKEAEQQKQHKKKRLPVIYGKKQCGNRKHDIRNPVSYQSTHRITQNPLFGKLGNGNLSQKAFYYIVIA